MTKMIETNHKPTIYCTQALQEEVMTSLSQRYNVKCSAKTNQYELMQGVRDTDGLICLLTDKINMKVIDQNPQLKVISTVSVGHDRIDVDYATSLGIPVANTPGVLTQTTADHAILLMLAAGRNLIRAVTDLRGGNYEGWKLEDPYLGVDLYKKTVGIVGFGQIGQAIGKRAHGGFEMEVLYNNRSQSPNGCQDLGYSARYVALDELLRKSDFVSANLPLTKGTVNFFGTREFGLMKPTAVFVNTSRGSVVDEEALIRALANGTIAAAGIDVFKNEPNINLNLLSVPNLTISPHIGSSSKKTRTQMSELAVENLDAALEGNPIPNLVNPDYIRHRRYTHT